MEWGSKSGIFQAEAGYHLPMDMALLDFVSTFTIECDALSTTIESVLMQHERPIAYFSQALKGRTLLLSIYENELFALVFVVAK